MALDKLSKLICNHFLPLSLHSSHAGLSDVLPTTSHLFA